MEKPLLILDLDETLVYGTETGLEREPDFLCTPYLIYQRPYLSEFVNCVREKYRLGIWTSSSESYMDCVISNIFPSGLQFEFTWSRERCTRVFDAFAYTESWVKDLKKLKRRGYSLDRLLMVDDTQAKLRRNYGNLVLVSEWVGSPEDAELKKLGQYLGNIHDTPSFRAIEKGAGGRPPNKALQPTPFGVGAGFAGRALCRRG